MKEYRFCAENGEEILLETEHSDTYYFGLYVTCDSMGEGRKWCPPSQLVNGNILRLWSYKLDKAVELEIPEDIYKTIMQDYFSVCRNTGKIIVATVKEGDQIITTKLGFAVALVNFKSDIDYCMPKDMETVVRVHSCDKNIYYNRCCEGQEVEIPYAKEGQKHYYVFNHITPNDPCYFELNGPEGDGVKSEYSLTLEVITPYKDEA